ncbi:hypothetical protein J2858_003845 [Neorhizobium galegae]|uniref:hypothetical protein n=1 Tax=Rhizobium/Agrobacterium group TaxID=227290 RepID=UPI001AE601BE|nr:hypothetical protein [Neorhizobium galegae]MBP2550905.1 hypothetical protein [Neorhizobium galegae]
MKFLDPHHPFFKPLWRRILTALLPLAWGAVELYNGSTGWGLMFLVAGAYAAYELLIIYDRTMAQAAAEEARKNAAKGDEE